MITKQELFNKMWNGLKAQNWKRSGVKGSDGVFRCAYFGPDGCRCALGQVLPDELESHPACTVEADVNASGLVARIPELGELLDWCSNHGFIEAMQFAHDKFDESGIQRRIRDVAKRYSLAIPEDV